MKLLAPVVLFAVACHYVFLALLSSHLAGWRAAALAMAVACGALFLFVAFLDTEDKR